MQRLVQAEKLRGSTKESRSVPRQGRRNANYLSSRCNRAHLGVGRLHTLLLIIHRASAPPPLDFRQSIVRSPPTLDKPRSSFFFLFQNTSTQCFSPRFLWIVRREKIFIEFMLVTFFVGDARDDRRSVPRSTAALGKRNVPRSTFHAGTRVSFLFRFPLPSFDIFFLAPIPSIPFASVLVSFRYTRRIYEFFDNPPFS